MDSAGVHGDPDCRAKRRFKCSVCARAVCWCSGADGDDRFESESFCNDCWYEAHMQYEIDHHG